ncbi:MAG TPA: IPT/TIG domain-containing protein, partial [Blastocatellia bacterium]|nr:IPT/TIG domain-containing protein [Blastocatellia bacterium]
MKNAVKSLVLFSLLLTALIPARAQSAAPIITSLSATSLSRSGRLIIQGANFGATAGQVRVGGVAAPVTRWADTMIVAYVPE